LVTAIHDRLMKQFPGSAEFRGSRDARDLRAAKDERRMRGPRDDFVESSNQFGSSGSREVYTQEPRDGYNNRPEGPQSGGPSGDHIAMTPGSAAMTPGSASGRIPSHRMDPVSATRVAALFADVNEESIATLQEVLDGLREWFVFERCRGPSGNPLDENSLPENSRGAVHTVAATPKPSPNGSQYASAGSRAESRAHSLRGLATRGDDKHREAQQHPVPSDCSSRSESRVPRGETLAGTPLGVGRSLQDWQTSSTSSVFSMFIWCIIISAVHFLIHGIELSDIHTPRSDDVNR